MGYFIEVDTNIKLFIEDYGSKNDKPIIFVSGWPFDHRSYEYQFNEIPQHGFRCIGIDLRGFGASDKPWADYNYDIFADDVEKVLQKLNLKNCMFVGHSMGGATALHYVAKYGSKYVSKLMLCGAAAPRLSQAPDFPHGLSQADLKSLIELCYHDRAKLITNFCNMFFYDTKALSSEFLTWNWITGMQASPHATVECLKLFTLADLHTDMQKISIPTLIAHGKHDKVSHYALGEILHKNIVHSKLVTFEKSGHGLFYDEREKFNKIIIDFAQQ